MNSVTTNNTATRGRYNEIISLTDANGQKISVSTVIGKYSPALPETFVSFDRKMRGDSLNLDLYAYDAEQNVAIIQIRHFFKRYARGFANIHKDYVLVGQNEITGEFFRHPISAHAVHAAIRKNPSDPAAAVRAAQRWMWKVTEKQLANGERQGDIFMVPSRKPSADYVEIAEKVFTVGGSHEIRSPSIFVKKDHNDEVVDVVAMHPSVLHTKQQHDPIFANEERFYSIRVAQEAATWKWGVRLGD